MFVTEISTGERLPIQIELVDVHDYKKITKARYFFDWKKETDNAVYKLCIKGQNDILGLMSLVFWEAEERIEIKLLAVSMENVGASKAYDHISGRLIAFAARFAIKMYGAAAAVSLIPKSLVAKHYMDKYGFEVAGKSLFIHGSTLYKLIEKYEV